MPPQYVHDLFSAMLTSVSPTPPPPAFPCTLGFAVVSVTTFLENNLQLDMPPEVAGVTFLAFGNGAPDVFAAIVALTTATDKESALLVGVASLLGSCACLKWS